MRTTASATRAAEMAEAYLDRWEQSGAESPEDVQSLVRLATSDDPSLARSGTEAIFRVIVERLGDRFEPRCCELYMRFFSRVLDICRRLPQGQSLDRRLRAFGLHGESEFLSRAERVRRLRSYKTDDPKRVRKVLVLSRVTLGADVAVTSVVLGAMKRRFKKAEICFLAGAKSASLFASDSRLTPIEVEYRRGGTLLERLSAWPALADRIAAETRGLQPREYLIVDPDSRLTQLGLLPVAPEESRYCFFESRSCSAPGVGALSELTGRWLDEVFGSDTEPNCPYVSLSEQDRGLGEAVRQAAAGPLAAVNLGVGENPAKRLDKRFERDLLLALLEAGYTVLLDRGAGAEELRRTAGLTASLRQDGKAIGAITSKVSSLRQVNTWEGSLSGFTGLIRVSDLYVGYDSAGGHLAAALGVRGIDIFSGAASPRMRERWRPWGPGRADVVEAAGGLDPSEVLTRVRELL